jgi:hypothetical protein|tara:strand:- start:1061 stop:1219 length:159 start_codon:yes stop_codon:yes gene_type:complete
MDNLYNCSVCDVDFDGSSAHSVLKKKRLRDKRLSDRKEKFDYEIVDMDIKKR